MEAWLEKHDIHAIQLPAADSKGQSCRMHAHVCMCFMMIARGILPPPSLSIQGAKNTMYAEQTGETGENEPSE